MNVTDIKKLIGRKVLVTHRGLILTGKLEGIADGFGGRDVMVRLPNDSKARRFWASKVSEIKNRCKNE